MSARDYFCTNAIYIYTYIYINTFTLNWQDNTPISRDALFLWENSLTCDPFLFPVSTPLFLFIYFRAEPWSNGSDLKAATTSMYKFAQCHVKVPSSIELFLVLLRLLFTFRALFNDFRASIRRSACFSGENFESESKWLYSEDLTRQMKKGQKIYINTFRVLLLKIKLFLHI